jgi:hypothetical protein
MLLGIMSGTSVEAPPESEEQRLLGKASCSAALAGVLTLPLWVLGLVKLPASAERWRTLLAEGADLAPPAVGVWALAGAAVVFFLALLPWTQRRPRLRSRAEMLFRAGKVKEVIDLLSAHSLDDFPPGWLPPPDRDFREPPTLLDVMEAVRERGAAWVRERYADRFRQFLAEPLWYWYYDAELERLVALLGRMPDGPALARHLRASVAAWEKRLVDTKQRVEMPWEPDDPEYPFPLVLHPKPQPTGRREQVLADLVRLAEQP